MGCLGLSIHCGLNRPSSRHDIQRPKTTPRGWPIITIPKGNYSGASISVSKPNTSASVRMSVSVILKHRNCGQRQPPRCSALTTQPSASSPRDLWPPMPGNHPQPLLGKEGSRTPPSALSPQPSALSPQPQPSASALSLSPQPSALSPQPSFMAPFLLRTWHK
jgi:hypothetical protein